MRSSSPLVSGVNPAAALLVGVLSWALRTLPAPGRAWLAGCVGRLAYYLGIRRRVTLGNLRASLPELPEPERRAIARGAYTNMALAVIEALAFARMTPEALAAAVEVENWPLFESVLKEGRGVLVATAHFGSWEILGEVAASRGIPLHAVVRPLKGALNARLMANREKSGLKLIPPRGAISGTLKALKEGGVVAMLMDQALPAKSSLFVPFFGRPASTSPALSMASLRSGAPVFVAMGARERGRLRVFLEGPFGVENTGDRHQDLTRHTAQVTAVLERYIRRYPEQWLWLHRRWKK